MPPSPIFPTTDWSLIERCAGGSSTRCDQERLLATYMPALQAYVRAARRCTADEAEELVQGFAARKLVEQSIGGRARRDQGRFRTYLLTVFQRYLTDQYRRDAARQRHHRQLSEQTVSRPDAPADAPDAFDVAWARSLLNQVATQMQQRLATEGRAPLWRLFETRVLIPILQQTPPPPYAQMVKDFGFVTATEACSAVVTAKRMFARLLRENIAQYVRDEREIDDELNDLRRILSQAR